MSSHKTPMNTTLKMNRTVTVHHPREGKQLSNTNLDIHNWCHLKHINIKDGSSDFRITKYANSRF